MTRTSSLFGLCLSALVKVVRIFTVTYHFSLPSVKNSFRSGAEEAHYSHHHYLLRVPCHYQHHHHYQHCPQQHHRYHYHLSFVTRCRDQDSKSYSFSFFLKFFLSNYALCSECLLSKCFFQIFWMNICLVHDSSHTKYI